MEYMIEIKNLNKSFPLINKETNSIRARLLSLITGRKTMVQQTFKALSDVHLAVKKGEILGIKGPNGSGKSTLLKIIMGAMQPDEGSVVLTQGRKLKLSLGMGFDRNLTGRHNIYLNASILGLTFEEIHQRFDEIVSFADLENFINTPLRFYSNGMKSRLAFSIAIQADADILLIDEFFGSVGDDDFKEKSNRKFQEFVSNGKTIILVSHSNKKINKHCDRVLFLEKGSIVKERVIPKKRKMR